jgi:hypothetical protein
MIDAVSVSSTRTVSCSGSASESSQWKKLDVHLIFEVEKNIDERKKKKDKSRPPPLKKALDGPNTNKIENNVGGNKYIGATGEIHVLAPGVGKVGAERIDINSVELRTLFAECLAQPSKPRRFKRKRWRVPIRDRFRRREVVRVVIVARKGAGKGGGKAEGNNPKFHVFFFFFFCACVL